MEIPGKGKWEKVEEGIYAKEYKKVEIGRGKEEWLIVVRNEAEENQLLRS